MDEFIGLLGLLIMLALFALFGMAVGVGGLLLSSHAVLYSEEKDPMSYYFTCTYFTGTRSVTLVTGESTGCKRFIPVGGSN